MPFLLLEAVSSSADLSALRDWLDAYRFFDVPLFSDDPAVLSFVTSTARLRA